MLNRNTRSLLGPTKSPSAGVVLSNVRACESTVMLMTLFDSAPSLLVLSAKSLNLPLATLMLAVTLLLDVKVAV